MATVSSTSTSGTTSLAISGLASGFDWQSLVSQLVQVERAPETQLQSQQSTIQQQNNSLGSIKTELGVLQNDVTTLNDPSFFDSRIATSSSTGLASASAASGTAIGSYQFNVTQLATTAAVQGTAGVGAALNTSNDVSGLTLSSAGFANPVTAGTFTVNGKQITISTSDTLQSVFDQISSVTGGGVTASYSASTDKITLSSGSPIVLGSATDTSNFLQVTKLRNAGPTTLGSAAALGLSGSDDVPDETLASAAFATPVTAGSFTVNGKQITVATTDTLQSVFDQISTATGGAVTASYSATDDKITLSSSSSIVLGSTTDTSNFLQAAGLSNAGPSAITSSSSLGAVKTTGAINQANFALPITGDTTGSGSFMINGVTINYNTASDGIADVISRINDSTAGVVASYDSTNDRFTLTDKNTGDVGISVQDVTGNFMAATGLAGGNLVHGNDLLYAINGGPQLSSQSNTITDDSSGITGLSVNASGTGSFSVSVASDTNTIKTAITNLATEYNKVESVIGTQTASTTDASGTVTAGLLAGNMDVESLATSLRTLMTGAASNVSGQPLRLDDLGFSSNGTDNSLSTSDTSGLDSALATNLSGLKDLFTNSSSGLAVQLNSFLNDTIGDNGTLVNEQAALTKQSSDIDTQISNIETQVQAYQDQLDNEFVAMETAEATTNQQMEYLQQAFGSSTSSS